jgi:hypothetical protein
MTDEEDLSEPGSGQRMHEIADMLHSLADELESLPPLAELSIDEQLAAEAQPLTIEVIERILGIVPPALRKRLSLVPKRRNE